jgi:DNA ligase-1
LNEATLSIGRPVAYMLATPLESIASPLVAADFILEDKIDGVRAQIHKRDDVRIFARGLEDVTRAFPEIVEAFRDVEGHVALDGELVSFATSGRPRPFQALQRRLQRVSPTKEQIAETPVTFVAYDLLADDGGDRLALSWEDRRALLEMFANDRSPKNSFVINPYESAISKNDETLEITVDRAFNCARQRGHEGVVLKRIDAPYEAGRRGQSWIKVKKAFATLDVIVTAVEAGHGKRAGTLSDYTFGVWRGDEIVNVGKAYSGLTDAEIETMSKRFVLSTLERFGGVRLVKPEVVIEVAFDGLQRSTRHKSGFALRFPRIVRIRDDKKPEDADRIEGVEALFRQQVESGHREDPPPEEAKKKIASDPKSQKSTKKASKVAKTRGVQLDLFASIKERG